MVTAIFRFHDELNDFLPRERRGRDFASVCAQAATTKHMIEALGVPHTEVEAVLVNGEESGFDRVLREGDRVAVYPRFEVLAVPHGEEPDEVSPLERLRERPRERMRFVADSHLGGLARLLRMAGFDTLYDNHYHDDDVEDLAHDQDRIVLTRDRELLKRRAILHGCYIHALDPPDQLRELFQRLDLGYRVRPFSLCLHCNRQLRAVGKEEVAARLPASVAAQHDSFTTCDQCLRVYWKGSHYRRMDALLAAVRESGADTLAGFADVESPEENDHHP
ncbi:twitching motility protein PilT [Massilia sp. KIM]|uniref:Mut7-C RNAse domain-containing protein n=1 Tax=Massilia sp. KIM TaxID=1955422 RepID=UPI00098EC6A9|nr:Mut7-C RNAse domain-containing protein [Massilia sp. KIM]OON63248.1 twitching motility protein PilT [Massilia sp. KIM]